MQHLPSCTEAVERLGKAAVLQWQLATVAEGGLVFQQQ